VQIGSGYLARASLEYADVAVEPEVAHIGLGDFHDAEELIRLGEDAAKEAVPEMQRKLAAH
jgi:predicted acylesterase/phospholipase RssA